MYEPDAPVATAYASMNSAPADSGSSASTSQNCVSKYRGVSWIKANQKWKAQITIDGKQTYLGLFESEVEAAFAYDEHAIALGKPVNFATQEGQKQAAPKRKLQGSEFIGIRPSKYKGVNWCRFSQKWKAQIQIAGKKAHLGCFDDEESAAHRYDEHAGPAGKPVNFPKPGQVQAIPPRKHVAEVERAAAEREAGGGGGGGGGALQPLSKVLSAAEGGVVASPYKGVSWKQGQLKWRAQIQIDGTMHYLGYFDTQEEAARKYDEYASDLGRPLNFPNEGGAADEGGGTGEGGEQGSSWGGGGGGGGSSSKRGRFVASKAVRAATAARAASEAAAVAAVMASTSAAAAAAAAATNLPASLPEAAAGGGEEAGGGGGTGGAQDTAGEAAEQPAEAVAATPEDTSESADGAQTAAHIAVL